LGVVGNVAEVELNGQSVGTCWIRGQELDITAAARTGTNTLTVRVTNTLINRVAGWKEVPPVPDHLVARYGHGLERNLSGARGVIGFQPLPNSGLLGPVVIRPAQRVVLPIER
jgi:hypothetical protein